MPLAYEHNHPHKNQAGKIMQAKEIQELSEVFVEEGAHAIGAVRQVNDNNITVFIEGHGDVNIPLDQIASVHDSKVMLSESKLSDEVKKAIRRAHDQERR